MASLPIDPIRLLSQVGVNETTDAAPAAAPVASPEGSIFDRMLGRAVDSLNSVSEVEMNANRLIDEYIAGRAELSDVMLATAKMTLAVQLAVTTVTTAVSTFKEITQMPI